MRYFVLPYKRGSRSALALAQELEGSVLRLEGSRYRRREGQVIINWGNNNPTLPCAFNGNQESLEVATNKLYFFRRLKYDNLTPDFWEAPEDIPDEAFPIVCRTILRGHSGVGIAISNSPADLVDCSLYVRYVKKQEEYRVHLGKRGNETETISVQRKVARAGAVVRDWRVRNHDGGFIYQRGGINPPPEVLSRSHEAFSRLGLDFGAVDTIWNERQQRAYVLEVNTAPGLVGQSTEDYANFFRSFENV